MESKFNKEDFNAEVEKRLNDFEKKVTATLNILVVGRVSTGKSSFLNAFFDREKNNPLFKVGAQAGVTCSVKYQEIGKNIRISDTPGLDDIKKENSTETEKMINEGVDIGILILSGAADSTQQLHYKQLKDKCKKVFVVLNKSDEFTSANREIVIKQWSELLKLEENERIFPVISRGYDENDKIIDPITHIETEIPTDKYGRPQTTQGIDVFRESVITFLEIEGKALILEKELKNKLKKASYIIITACTLAAGEALIPGSALYIGATQAVAISSIAYLYTGKVISKQSILSVIGIAAAENLGVSLFLVIKSFFPPTGILDVAAASIALSITAALLISVTKLFEKGYTLEDKREYTAIFKELLPLLTDLFKKTKGTDLSNKNFIAGKLTNLIFNNNSK